MAEAKSAACLQLFFAGNPFGVRMSRSDVERRAVMRLNAGVSAIIALAATAFAGEPVETSGFAVESGAAGSYILFEPPIRSEGPLRPVMLFLNGKGENGDDGLRHVSRNFWAADLGDAA